ncbi:MAG: ribonuclease D [Actinomycetales bacterium]|nr:ribonuclease D [Actinomycetales bacterium]
MVRVQVIATRNEFLAACETIAAGEGPIAIDAERASGFTYSQRAYLIQVHRRNAGTFLFDPPAIGDMTDLQQVTIGCEWVLHAASQDLSCLREVGITPTRIFDTELSSRLLGMERVGLGAVVEELLGIHLKKEHSAADWSTRPLPESWLTYASLDVELLVDLRDEIEQMLIAVGKLDYAYQEFEATLAKPEKAILPEPWRRLSGLNTLRTARQIAVARELWLERDSIAQTRDVSPGRLIPDSAIVTAAHATLSNKQALATLTGFNGRASRTLLDSWWAAIKRGLETAELPEMRVRSDSIPPPRSWADRRPEALDRLNEARAALLEIAKELEMPVENVLTPSMLREVAWAPPAAIDAETVGAALSSHGARAWQVEATAQRIALAFVEAPQKQKPEPVEDSSTATSD